MSTRLRLLAALLVLSALLAGCGGAGPLVDPSVVPRAAVTGRVVDAASGQPVAGARVFLAGTSHRATTDGQGTFTLTGVPAGVYEIAAHQPGYAPVTSTVAHRPADSAAGPSKARLRLSTTGAPDPRSDTSRTRLATDAQVPEDLAPAAREAIETLRQRVEQLESRVALISRQVGLLRDEQRGTARLQMNEGELEAFKESFLGEDREKCKLLNPGVLSFEAADEESVVLQATTDQPLEVMNRRLGYRLRVVLDRFTMAESGRTTTVLSDALVSFEPLPPGDEGVAERWRETRHAAYQGSRVHLLRALGAGRAEDEGFTVDRPAEVERRTSASLAGRSYTVTRWIPLRDLRERVAPGGAPHVRMIRLEERHRVRHEGGAAWYLSLSEDVERFTVLGQPLAPGAVQTEGYWPVRPICHRVPANYVPEDS
jgi:predicted small lipoprotein YifL